MASIVYSICGEGRGHATRARTVVEGLRQRHRLTLFASGCAHDLLAPYCRAREITLHRVPDLVFVVLPDAGAPACTASAAAVR
jgi:hypothetical protein